MKKTICYRINENTIEKVRSIAYWDRKQISEIAQEALTQYIKKWDDENSKQPVIDFNCEDNSTKGKKCKSIEPIKKAWVDGVIGRDNGMKAIKSFADQLQTDTGHIVVACNILGYTVFYNNRSKWLLLNSNFPTLEESEFWEQVEKVYQESPSMRFGKIKKSKAMKTR